MRNSCKLFILAVVLGVSTMSCSDVLGVTNKEGFNYDDYAAVLKSYVDDAGMVNYKKLKAHSEKLKTFITSMSQLDPNNYDKWDKNKKIAFWLNAYNAFTLKVIIDNYPIKPSFLKSWYYPKNSIRQIKGVWDKVRFNVMGRDLTLGHMEHEILRKKFDEPRIHMAMVCAAMGCPLLLNKPCTAQRLDEQLDDQTRRFLANPKKFKLDRDKNRVYLSPIFKWFADDFVDKYGSEENIAKHSKKTSAVLNFVATYLNKNDSDNLRSGKLKIKYLKYDWSLNEQQVKAKQSQRPNK